MKKAKGVITVRCKEGEKQNVAEKNCTEKHVAEKHVEQNAALKNTEKEKLAKEKNNIIYYKCLVLLVEIKD
jgi:phosphoribosyl-ATP pyrophosphohydrolase